MYLGPKGLHSGPVPTPFPRVWWEWKVMVAVFSSTSPLDCPINDFTRGAKEPSLLIKNRNSISGVTPKIFFPTIDVKEK